MIRWPFAWPRRRDVAVSAPGTEYRPYADETADRFYHLLFCDDAAPLRSHGSAQIGSWRALTALQPQIPALQAIVAADGDSRARALAAQLLLRSGTHCNVARTTLGAVLEVALSDGLEVLAAYADGTVRYLARDGHAVAYERGPPKVQALARKAVTHAHACAGRLTVWRGPRLPPPRTGDVRISMLATDGLRFVQGSFASLQRDADSAALIGSCSRLLRLLTPDAAPNR